MRKRLNVPTILAFLTLALVAPATVAQTKKKTATPQKNAATAKPSATAAAPVYDTKPFDTSASKLPVRYRGHSFRKIYETVVLVPPKGEFETTAEFEQRSRRTLDGLHALVLQDVKSTYNADEEVMAVQVETTEFHPGLGVEREAGYVVEARKVSERKYPASNAFGASVIVTETSFETSGIIPKPGPLSGGATFQINVPRADAQRLKPDLRALAVVRIGDEQQPPFGKGEANGFRFAEAKIDSPSEVNVMEFLLRAEVADLWVFNRSTGQVLAKHSDRPDHAKMQLSVYESKDHDGYAIVSLAGNKDLTLKRGFSEYGGGCHIVVGGYYEIVGMKGGVWSTGTSMVDFRGRKGVVITSGDGTVLFDHPTPTEYGKQSNPTWLHGEEAARSMWQAVPNGRVEVKGDDYSSFATKAPLAGFRELWEWGVSNCGFPSFENKQEALPPMVQRDSQPRPLRGRPRGVVELLGRNRLIEELLLAGLEVALPLRDRGSDLIAYADLAARVASFAACPIQMKASSESAFGLNSKYRRVRNLIIAHVRYVGQAAKSITIATTYAEALSLVHRMRLAESPSWASGAYSTSQRLLTLLEPFRITPERWWAKVVGTQTRSRSGIASGGRINR